MPQLSTQPVTARTWNDFETLFGGRGAPHFCWCAVYRVAGSDHLDSGERRAAVRELVDQGVPVGVLAYDGRQAVGWCSVAPRESYARLARSRTMPRVTDPAELTWTVLCFFVPRALRGQGVTHELLRGAVDYASESGADIIEGYPFDSAGISSTHRGHSSVFAAAGFTNDGRRWWKRTSP